MINGQSLEKEVLKHIPLYVTLLDKELNVVWGNNVAKDIHQVQVNNKCYHGFNRDEEQCTFCPVVRSLASGKRESSFIEVFDPDEELDKVYEVIAVPVLNEEDQVTGIYEMRKDVSSQLKGPDTGKIKKTKEEIFSSEHLLDIVSIELKGHLDQAIKMHKKMHMRDLSQEDKIGLAGMKTSLSKIDNVLSNITTMRNINKGAMKHNKKKSDLKKLMTDILQTYENKIDLNGNNFDYKYDSNIPSKLILDPTKFSLVISNLLDFATAHTSNRSIYLITALKDSNDDQVTVSVKLDDVGSITIHDEVKKDINNYLKQNLTLSVIKYLVKLQGGEMKVRPQSGYGVNIELTFTFKRPFASNKLPFLSKILSARVKETKPNPLFESKQRKKVLVAEDDPISRITIEQILSKDYDVILAKNGKVAVDKYFECSPDIVIMDIMMPVMNGFDAFDEIHHNCIKRVPIIACTSKVIRSEKEYLTSYGFDDYIAKPVNLTTLKALIKKHIG